MKLVVWDVQHGNALYLRTPGGLHCVFDLGMWEGAGRGLTSPLERLKAEWDVEKLDYLLISHPHDDHIGDIGRLITRDGELLDLSPRVLARPKATAEGFELKGDKYRLFQLLSATYTTPVAEEHNPCLPNNSGGSRIMYFGGAPKQEKDNVNNYSLVAVITYGTERIVIPGDLEAPGWESLFANSEFVDAVRDTHLLVASHHGRQAGYHERLFDYLGTPQLVVISDGRAQPSSITDVYSRHSSGFRVEFKSDGTSEPRKTLTTRNNGWLLIETTVAQDRTCRRVVAQHK